jgi:hypothetical protein
MIKKDKEIVDQQYITEGQFTFKLAVLESLHQLSLSRSWSSVVSISGKNKLEFRMKKKSYNES